MFPCCLHANLLSLLFKLGTAHLKGIRLIGGNSVQVGFVAFSEGVVFIVFGASAVAELSKLGGGLG